MKAFIERVFRSKKQKQKELLDEITHTKVKKQATKVKDQATEAVVEAIVKEVKPAEVPKIEVPKVETPKEVFKKPGHYFPDCNCFKCVRWRHQNA